MADDGSAQSKTIWPLPAFHFKVTFGNGLAASFQEVSGLSSETQVIEYRHGDSPNFSTIKMPGITKVGNVTLKKGVFAGDKTFWDWYGGIKPNGIQRQTVVIELLDEQGATTMKWTLTNAWPTKFSGTDLKSEGNEVAIETLEVAFESLAVAGT